MKRPNHRVFDYTPRYYNPETDVKEKRKKKLGFRYARKSKYRKKSPVIAVIILIAVILFYMKLRGMF